MTARQLMKSLENFPHDYLDEHLSLMFVDKDGYVNHQILAFSAITVGKNENDDSYPVLGSAEVAVKLSNEGKARMFKTGLPPTERELNPPADSNET